ncbi:iron complex transport system permease protein [Alkalibacillus flavidus]|uniref:Iron complex transport system permease protein n=1 Tax=Alkalibacillus flavidus TaxID=546021 RepID=A0ABV2KT36_9BACI
MIHPSLIRKQRVLLGFFSTVLILTVVIGLQLGDSTVAFERIIATFIGQGTFEEEFVLFSIRLPRIVITILAGVALALSGAILQAVTKNDLADPGIIGINSGAGVAVAIYFLYCPIDSGSFIFMLPFVAFLGAFLTAGMIYALSYRKQSGIEPVRLVLTGVGFSMAFSGLMVVLISSAEREKVDFIVQWMAGDIWGTDWPFVYILLPWLLFLVPVIFWLANSMNILSLHQQASVGVGLRIEKVRLILLLIAVALAASAVSVTGGISFIGLLAPHLAKQLVGPRTQLYLPICLVIGGWLLLVADLIGMNLLQVGNVPAGIVVALIGAPYFVYLLMRK